MYMYIWIYIYIYVTMYNFEIYEACIGLNRKTFSGLCIHTELYVDVKHDQIARALSMSMGICPPTSMD